MIALPLTGCIGGGGDTASASVYRAPTVPPFPVVFGHGVASGDPQSDRVILWTRVRPQDGGDTRDVPVLWEVAADMSFTTLVAQGAATARAENDFCVKVDAAGLKAGTGYWYRFKAFAATSPVGRTKTLPTGDVAQVKLAVFSCANYPAGYFNVYAEAAKRAETEGYDAVLHLGDYIYEYGPGQYASGSAEALGRVVEPPREVVALAEYRQRYAQYRADADLQKLHGLVPMIAVWDDHEIANNAWKDGAQNHQPDTEGEYAVRRAAAVQAWHEWLPVRDGQDPLAIHRGFDFGSLMSLHMLDTRVIARDRQLSYADYTTDAGLDSEKFQADMARTDRTLLGEAQAQWLQARMKASTATWQVLGQQVLMGRMDIPAPVVMETVRPGSGVTVGQYAAIALKALLNRGGLTPQERAVLDAPKVPYNLDAWDGYPVARDRVLDAARDLDKNLVVLAGDTHNAWANNLLDGADRQVGVEFATASVTSPGFETYLAQQNPALLAAGLTYLIRPLAYAETSHRGFMAITATAAECRCDWIFVNTIQSRDYTATVGKSLRTLPGAGQRKLIAV